MEIKREILVDQVPGLYAVGNITVDGRTYYAAASENRKGKVFLINADTKAVSEIEGGEGGVMAALDAADENAMFCIEEFYPVFDSATAKIIKVVLEKDGEGYKAAERRLVAEVPYVHRIAQLKEADGFYIAAGKLCKHKENSDDWSTSGTMEIGFYDKDKEKMGFEQVCDGIFKHHAMFVKRNAWGYDDLYYGGTAGAFRTVRKDGAWVTEQLLSVPVSDIVVEDLDGDGRDEIAIIEEFHGDKAVVFKENKDGWERALELPLSFGHVLWGGEILGRTGLITGSRSGEKKLILYRFGCSPEKGIFVSKETVIDEGQAPAQIIVIDEGDTAWIVAANHGAAQLTRYQCSGK